MLDWLTFTRCLKGSLSSRTGETSALEGAREAEGDAVGVAAGVEELSGWPSVSSCADICASSFQCPFFTRLQTIRKRGMPVLSTKETSTVAVAVVPETSSIVRKWIVEPCISYAVFCLKKK